MRKLSAVLCAAVFASALSTFAYADELPALTPMPDDDWEDAPFASDYDEMDTLDGLDDYTPGAVDSVDTYAATATPAPSPTPTPTPEPDVAFGNDIKGKFSGGVSNFKSESNATKDGLANMPFEGFSSFLGAALAWLPAQLTTAFLIMIICAILRVALSILVG